MTTRQREALPPVRKSQAEHHALLQWNLIPADVRAQIQKADPSEVTDRTSYADLLSRQAQASTVPAERRRLSERARSVMRARPRAQVEKEVAALVAKAAGLGPAQGAQADALRRRAQDVLDQDPPAPRTPEEQARDAATVRAGGTTGLGMPRNASHQALPGDVPGRQVIKGAPLTAVYDQQRRLAGVADPARIRRRVSKADASGEAPVPVFDADGNLVGICDPDDITPVAGASAKPAAPAAKPASGGTAPAASEDQVIKAMKDTWRSATGRLATVGEVAQWRRTLRSGAASRRPGGR